MKQQQLYGIWDPADPDAGRRAFVARWRQRHADRRALVAGVTDGATPPQERMGLRTSYILKWVRAAGDPAALSCLGGVAGSADTTG